MTTKQLLTQIKGRLEAAHGERLRGVVLYGSEARGQAHEDSDIDLLVLLADPVNYGRDLEANLEALYPLALELGRRISAKPVSATEYETADCPLYRQAHREGIAA
ncbi:MAG TPA: nucleotidyltransferase domain-containing protein [Phycisphaerae bacterium]|nr:nucleotidyltransferase domain-containing protein [Phycisphaerae bacterium]